LSRKTHKCLAGIQQADQQSLYSHQGTNFNRCISSGSNIIVNLFMKQVLQTAK